MSGMLVRWTGSRGIGTILGRDAQAYAITAGVLRRSNIMTQSRGGYMQHVAGVQKPDPVVNDAIQEPGRIWDFIANEPQSDAEPVRLPEIVQIWKGENLGITIEQWRTLTGTMERKVKWPKAQTQGGSAQQQQQRPLIQWRRSQSPGPQRFSRPSRLPRNEDDGPPAAEALGRDQRDRQFQHNTGRDGDRGGGSVRGRSRDRDRARAKAASGNAKADELFAKAASEKAKADELFNEVEEWLGSLRLQGWTTQLREHGFDSLEDLQRIEQKDMDLMRMPRGYQRRILVAIADDASDRSNSQPK
eukprot:gene506-3435_t